METSYKPIIVPTREDNQLLVIMHLTQLLDYVTGFGGFIAPLVLWLSNKDRVMGMDEHGKSIINFQISLFIYCIISIPLIFLFGLGVIFLIGIAILGFVMPIINAIKASNGESPYYPFSLPIF
ncbi:DUF4870 domain-containing protein [Spongiivirga citrea]|uniref:DUF4870 domain-containing protein n=1 Tax=Spongiivirga citrea TaxID=1481457 RepID=A0A6M0CDF3_9FLAO|nr:DUF4870 domain-containing protein [Spongiivirga citrea]NER15848.1 DUF4870 domain-containing protein [Spongiivirga citrea]